MKKLMVMMGAVATALGLFADTPKTYYSTSFESTDPGCSGGTVFEWATAGWSYAEGEENPAIEAQTGVLPYADGKVRRDGYFTSLANNDKCLKLETGANTLSHAIEAGQVYIDQLVKFTGYEESPTEFAEGTKIAVWMSAIEADDTVDPVILGETNLYVAVGNGAGKTTSVKLNLEVQTDKWYRLTVKSLDDVIQDKTTGLTQAGFLIYVDGTLASVIDGEKDYYQYPNALNTTAKGYYDKGQLFMSMVENDATVSSVGYKGIGALDDLIISEDAPDFAAFVEPTIAAIPGAEVLKVVVTDGDPDVNVYNPETGKIQVAPGTRVTIHFVASDGYMLGTTTFTTTVNDATAIDASSAIKPEEIKVTVSWNEGNDSQNFADLTFALAKVQSLEAANIGCEVSVVKASAATVEQQGSYAFEAGTTIAINPNEHAWYILGNAVLTGVTVAPEATVMVTANEGQGGALTYSGTVAGTLQAETIKLANEGTITLTAEGRVITTSGLTAANFTVPEGYELHSEAGTGVYDGYRIYTAVEQPTQQPFVPSTTVAADLATAIDHLKNNYYNKYTNGQKIDAPDASYVKVGTLASDVTGTVSIGGPVADAGEKFSLSIGNNAFLESYKFKIVGREVYVAAVILAIEEVKVTASETPYPIDSAKSGQLKLESFTAVAPTTIAGEGTNFTIVRGDDKPLVKFFFTDEVTQYFVTKKTFIDKNDVATTSYGFTTPDEGGLWLYLGYGVGLGGNWDGVTYNYTVYAFGVDKKAITLSMSITDKGELTSWDDVTDNTPIADLPCLSDADKTALAAAKVSATKVSAWAKGNGNVTIGTDTIKLEAFLLNVANTDTAIATAKAEFKIPSITVKADGTVTVTNPTGSYNGTVTIKGSTTPNGDFTLPVTDTSARFFKAFLGL